MQRHPLSKAWQTVQTTLYPSRYILGLNSVVLLIFLALTVYVRVTNKGQVVEALFGTPFNYYRPYFGALTTLGNLLLCMAMAIYAFSTTLLKTLHLRQKTDRFILCTALLLGMILADRMLRLTVIVAAFWSAAGKPLMFLLYGSLLLGYTVAFRQRLLATPYGLLILAAALLVFGGVVDLLHLPGRGLPAMLEEGSTLLAMVNIVIYAWLVCRWRILTVIKQRESAQ